MRTCAGGPPALLLAGLLLLPQAAAADQRITAVSPSRFANPNVTIAQGERLTFQNLDVAAHDVVAEGSGPDGKPLFSTPLLQTNEEAFVEGSQFLVTGAYPFLCSVHPTMTGTLSVSTAGTPLPRPGPGQPAPLPASTDTSPPAASLVAAKRRKNAVQLTVDEPATVGIVAVRRKKTLAQGSAPLAGNGRPQTVRLKLTRDGRKALRRRRSVRTAVSATVRDSAGNASTAGTKLTLRR